MGRRFMRLKELFFCKFTLLMQNSQLKNHICAKNLKFKLKLGVIVGDVQITMYQFFKWRKFLYIRHMKFLGFRIFAF